MAGHQNCTTCLMLHVHSRYIGVVKFVFKVLTEQELTFFSMICPLLNVQCVKRMFYDL